MTKNNPSVGARTFVLAGPALALLFTAFFLATGTGARLLVAVWFCAAPGPSSQRSRASCDGD